MFINDGIIAMEAVNARSEDGGRYGAGIVVRGCFRGDIRNIRRTAEVGAGVHQGTESDSNREGAKIRWRTESGSYRWPPTQFGGMG